MIDGLIKAEAPADSSSRRTLGNIVRLSSGIFRVMFHEGDVDLTWDPPIDIDHLSRADLDMIETLRRAARIKTT